MEISFLLGAGFSVPDGYPTRKEINERLKKINHDEILIHTNGFAKFLEDDFDPNASWMHIEERFFVEEFLKFYNVGILKSEEFDYERFFDFYNELLRETTSSYEFESFYDDFCKKFEYRLDKMYTLNNFNRYYMQLLGGMFRKNLKIVHLCKPYTKYRSFLELIEYLGGKYEVINIHTLNHDLLMKSLAISDAIMGEISDGFDELDSPYYGKNFDNVTVRLRKFTNIYDKKFRLYKLHGSIDQYIFRSGEYISIKVPSGVNTSDFYKEEIDGKGKKYRTSVGSFAPDFLSGTTVKALNYKLGYYYLPILEDFKNNLVNSKFLISIGYGLGDKKINELIKERFLSNKTNKFLIINPLKVRSDLYDFDNVVYYGENYGVNEINLGKVKSLLGEGFN